MTKTSQWIGIGIVALAAGCGGAQTQRNEPLSNSVAVEDEAVTVDPATAPKTVDEVAAREKAIEDARAAGILGNPCAGANPCGAAAPVPATAGALDKDAIRGVIRANLGAIQICYEKRLLEDSALAGTTTASFTIAPDGTVSASSAAGFDPAVDACVAKAIQDRMTFPKPDAGGSVQVSYPFVFKSAP